MNKHTQSHKRPAHTTHYQDSKFRQTSAFSPGGRCGGLGLHKLQSFTFDLCDLDLVAMVFLKLEVFLEEEARLLDRHLEVHYSLQQLSVGTNTNRVVSRKINTKTPLYKFILGENNPRRP